MKITMGHSLAVVLATSSLAVAGGGGDGDDDKNKNVRTLERLGAPASASDATVTAKPGSGFTVTTGDDFSLNLSHRIQFLWEFQALEFGQDRNNFSILRARQKAKGHVWDKNKTYQLQVDWAGSPRIKDAWFNWQFWESENDDAIGLRVGSQKPHHGREFTGTSSGLEFTRRSIASRVFSGRRVTGAMLHGKHIEDGKLGWSAMVGNSDVASGSGAAERGDNANNADNEVNFFFDVNFDPWGEMGGEGYKQGDLDQSEEIKGSIGAGLMVGNHRDSGNTQDIESTSININTRWKYKGFHALAEVFLRTDDPDVTGGQESDHTGWSVGGSYTLPPADEDASQWAFGVRYAMVTNDDAANLISAGPLGTVAGDLSQIEGMVSNYYKKHKLKTQLVYRHETVEPDAGSDTDNDYFEILFQWMF